MAGLPECRKTGNVLARLAAIATGLVLATAGCASYDGRRVVEVEFADASPCLQQCRVALTDCVPRPKVVRGLGLTPTAWSGDLTAMKHEFRRCRQENEACNLTCNASDADTIALGKQTRLGPTSTP